MTSDQFHYFTPRGDRPMPLVAGEIAAYDQPWPRAVRLAASFVLSGALWTAIIIAICVIAAATH